MAAVVEKLQQPANIKDTTFRELLKKEDRERQAWIHKWGWYWQHQQKYATEMNQIYHDNEDVVHDKTDPFEANKISEKVFPHVADAKMMKNWPEFSVTTTGNYGRFSMRPLERGGAVVSRPNVFSYKI